MLAENLALYYNTLWVPEYARQYLELQGPEYEEKDIVVIARGQLENEIKAAAESSGFLFCDTEFTVLKIWSEVKYRRCDPWIIKMFEQHIYDLYLLCDIDLPWEYDPLREHPEMRQELFERYFNTLSHWGLPFEVIRGIGDDRLGNAVKAITERLIKNQFI